MAKEAKNILVENARIIFRNFEGREDKFNRLGDRNFGLILDDHNLVDELKADGWNIKTLKKRDEDEDDTYWLPVAVSYRNIPPKVTLVTKHKQVLLDEDTVQTVDYTDIANVDLIVSPYHWEMNGKTGVKAYLKTMYVVVNEDEFADKYANREVETHDEPDIEIAEDDLPF